MSILYIIKITMSKVQTIRISPVKANKKYNEYNKPLTPEEKEELVLILQQQAKYASEASTQQVKKVKKRMEKQMKFIEARIIKLKKAEDDLLKCKNVRLCKICNNFKLSKEFYTSNRHQCKTCYKKRNYNSRKLREKKLREKLKAKYMPDDDTIINGQKIKI